MRLLLDTHIFLWAVSGDARLVPATRRLMQAAEAVFVSAASVWEVAIKARLGKIDADPQTLVDAIAAAGFTELPVRAVHAALVATMPLHHADPFDRLLLAQALHEPLRLLTTDAALVRYGDRVLMV